MCFLLNWFLILVTLIKLNALPLFVIASQLPLLFQVIEGSVADYTPPLPILLMDILLNIDIGIILCSWLLWSSISDTQKLLIASFSLSAFIRTKWLNLTCVLVWFSHRGSVSCPNSNQAIACSGVDLFPYLEKIKHQHDPIAAKYYQLEILILVKPSSALHQSAIHCVLWWCDPVSLAMNFNYGISLFFFKSHQAVNKVSLLHHAGFLSVLPLCLVSTAKWLNERKGEFSGSEPSVQQGKHNKLLQFCLLSLY